MTTLAFIPLSHYVPLRLILLLDLVDEIAFLNAGFLALRRVATTTLKLVEVKIWNDYQIVVGADK
jgi:hypothetical protein